MSNEAELNQLRESLNQMQFIKQKGFQQSTVLECFQQKLNELQSTKETIFGLESQLKIAKETLKLQLAEFTFQKSEFEAEIQNLQQQNENLRDALKRQDDSKSINVDLKVEKERNAEIHKKYIKWKNKAHEMKEQKNKLKSTIKLNDEEKKRLKASNIELQNQLESQSQALEEERQSTSSLSNESENYARKLQKAEEINSKLNDTNIDLSCQIKKLAMDNDGFKDQIQRLKEEIKSTRKQMKTEAENSQAQYKALAAEKADVESKLRHAKTKIQKYQLQIDAISNENDDESISKDEIIAKANHLEEDNQKLKIKNQSLQTKINRLQATIDEYQSIHPTLKNCEAEMAGLCDIVGIDPEDPSKPWTNLQKQIEYLVSTQSQVHGLKEQNATLKKRVLRLQTENKTKVQEQTASEIIADDYVDSLSEAIKQEKAKNALLQNHTSVLKRQLSHSHTIVNIYSTLTKQINELHAAIFDSNLFSLRPVILSIVFAHRFLKYKLTIIESDTSALSFFSGRIHIGCAAKIGDIKQKFSTLTQDLVSAKTEINDIHVQNRQINNMKETAEFELRNANDQLTLASKKLEHLKNRMYELQIELSTLVPPESYQDICQKLADSDNENQKLVHQIKSHDKELRKQNEIQNNLLEKIEHVRIHKRQYRSNIKELSEILSNREKIIESLKSLLREKTKEILALERQVSRQSKQNQVDNVSLQALAKENQAIQANKPVPEQNVKLEKSLITQVSMKATGAGIASVINPAFLQ